MTVTDNGPGIPPEARAHVFDRFYRADPARGREGSGSGLGLSICREIAEAHGGRVWVESEEGEGQRLLPGAARPSDSAKPATRQATGAASLPGGPCRTAGTATAR